MRLSIGAFSLLKAVDTEFKHLRKGYHRTRRSNSPLLACIGVSLAVKEIAGFLPPDIPLDIGVPILWSAHECNPSAARTRFTRSLTCFLGSNGKLSSMKSHFLRKIGETHWRRRAYDTDSRTVNTPRRASSCSTKVDILCISLAASGILFKCALEYVSEAHRNP